MNLYVLCVASDYAGILPIGMLVNADGSKVTREVRDVIHEVSVSDERGENFHCFLQMEQLKSDACCPLWWKHDMHRCSPRFLFS